MSFDAQYYILKIPSNEEYPRLVPTEATAALNFDFEALPPLGKPLFFDISSGKKLLTRGIEIERHPLYMIGSSFMVSTEVKNYLAQMSLVGMHFYPAVLIDETGNWDEDYWYLSIYSEIDCWDREKSASKVLKSPFGDQYDVRKYVLVENVLSAIPEAERQIFRMGGTARDQLFVHQNIIDYFLEAGVTGFNHIRLSEYKFGMEF